MRISDLSSDVCSSDLQAGAIRFPKRVVSFTDKTRYLFHIQKGIVGPSSRNKPFEVNRKIAPDKLRIPFEPMIFVGDGYTDIPLFSPLRRSGGVAFGVSSAERRGGKEGVSSWSIGWSRY